MNEQSKKDALQYLKNQHAGVVSSVSQGQSQSSYVYYVCDDDFNVYFTTFTNSRKHQNIMKDNRVSFTVGSITPPCTVQLEGLAEMITDTQEITKIFAQYAEIALTDSRYMPPITKLGLEYGIVIYKITTKWLQWSDFRTTNITGDLGPTAAVVIIG